MSKAEGTNKAEVTHPEIPTASDALTAVYRQVLKDLAAEGFRGIRLDEVADTHRDIQASRPATSVIGRSIAKSLRRHLGEAAGPHEMP